MSELIDPKTGERPMTVHRAMEIVAAQQRGREKAKQNAAIREAQRQAKLPQQPVNAAQYILDNCDNISISKSSLRDLKKIASKTKDRIEAEIAERERQEKIDKDPAVINSRENADCLLKLAPLEFQEEAAEAAAVAGEGDVSLYWQMARDLEQKIWAAEDEDARQKLLKKKTTNEEFLEQAQRAITARERFEHAEKMAAGEEPPK